MCCVGIDIKIVVEEAIKDGEREDDAFRFL